MRGNLDARSKPNCGNAQPKQFSPEEQNYNADERADNRDRKMNWRERILYCHGVEKFVANPVYLIWALDTSTATTRILKFESQNKSQQRKLNENPSRNSIACHLP